MAGNKMSTKKRDDKNKSSRNVSHGNEDTEEIDFSLLRKPILTSITGFAQARKIFDLATEELKGIISNECDLLYECKVCRNIFRSLLNFISHKRIYCKDNFNTSQHGHFLSATPATSEILKIKQLEEDYQGSLKDTRESAPMEDDERIPLSKDLSKVIERITLNRGIPHDQLENQQITLETIPKSSVAVFQSVNFNEGKGNMRAQIQEINKMLSRDKAILQSDGNFAIQNADCVIADTDSVIQISDDDENDSSKVLKCKICDQQFSTQKTLKVHMKYKHLESRLVFPCPDCLEIFSTSWSVYRHLFKVHRKTTAQIRKLRESIQLKAFHMNNPPAFYEKRKMYLKNVSTQKKTEEERLEQENQAWMDDMEADGELPRCGGCGRAFERRAALAAHTHTCPPRSRARARCPPRIAIQIRKDYRKGPAAEPDSVNKNESNETLPATPVNKSNESKNDRDNLMEAEMTVLGTENKDNEEVETADRVQHNTANDDTFVKRLPFAYLAEKSNQLALKQKMLQDVQLEKLQCKKCNIECNFNKQELIDHMAAHYKWLRYGCKLCNFKNYYFENLPEHIKTVHKLKGDTDFYFSTIKAIDGTEALELSECTEETNTGSGASPDSRRPSRCSSDSSRVSDDSSSSSTRIVEVGSRKRKANIIKNNAKKKKESLYEEDDDHLKEDLQIHKTIIENDSSSNSKIFEENSSDMDDGEEKMQKRQVIDISSVALRRPVRKKTKPKNEDFEYDLSNLLKMEAQGYRDSQIISKSANPPKKKMPIDINSNYDVINKDCCGALSMMSRKSMENSKVLMKSCSFISFNASKETKPSNIFVRPLLPKPFKVDKISPKKDIETETNVITSPSKDLLTEPGPLDSVEKNDEETIVKSEKQERKTVNEDESKNIVDSSDSKNKETIDADLKTKNDKNTSIPEHQNDKSVANTEQKNDKSASIPELKNDKIVPEQEKSAISGIINKPILPINFRQGLEVIQNPLIKKNLTDFTKAGMKTKILVIKPISRGKDGKQSLNSPLKFQTIKLKDPNKTVLPNEEKKSAQVKVVPVPKVDCSIPRSVPSASNISSNLHSAVNSKKAEVNIPKNKDLATVEEGTTKQILINKNNIDKQIKEQSTEKISSDSEKIS